MVGRDPAFLYTPEPVYMDSTPCSVLPRVAGITTLPCSLLVPVF